MAVRYSLSPRVPPSAVSPGPAPSRADAPPGRGPVRPLLPGRRRLMREEDSSGTDSDGEEEDTVVPPSSVSYLRVSGLKRSTPVGQRESQEGLRSVFLAGPGSF